MIVDTVCPLHFVENEGKGRREAAKSQKQTLSHIPEDSYHTPNTHQDFWCLLFPGRWDSNSSLALKRTLISATFKPETYALHLATCHLSFLPPPPASIFSLPLHLSASFFLLILDMGCLKSPGQFSGRTGHVGISRTEGSPRVFFGG